MSNNNNDKTNYKIIFTDDLRKMVFRRATVVACTNTSGLTKTEKVSPCMF